MIASELMGRSKKVEPGFIGESPESLKDSLALKDLWHLTYEAWAKISCGPSVMDERPADCYRHPVWVLNGIFIKKVPMLKAKGKSDFGGGFGRPRRLICEKRPTADVEVMDPYPHNVDLSLPASSRARAFVGGLIGEYDVTIATDIFEHVVGPTSLPLDAAGKIGEGSKFLIANAFQLGFLCLLPQILHRHFAWDQAMKDTGRFPGERILCGRFHERICDLSLSGPTEIERIAQRIQTLIKVFPRVRAKIGLLMTLSVASWR